MVCDLWDILYYGTVHFIIIMCIHVIDPTVPVTISSQRFLGLQNFYVLLGQREYNFYMGQFHETGIMRNMQRKLS